MKKYFMLLIVVTLFSGCQVEPLDPSLRANLPTTGTTASIVGSWDYQDFRISVATSATILGNTVTQTTVTNLVSTTGVATFTSNGTATVTGNATENTVVDGVSVGIQTRPLTDSGTYVVNGNRLVTTSATQDASGAQIEIIENFTIEILTATNLRLTFNEVESETIAGVTTQTTTSGFYTFTRQ